MDRIEYEATLRQSYFLLSVAMQMNVEDALTAAHRSDAIGGLFDPTLWMRNHEKLRQDIEVMEAVNRLKQLAVNAGMLEGAQKT